MTTTNMRGPAWYGWEAVAEPAEIIFVSTMNEYYQDILINSKRVGWLERRPPYCDRGHWKFGCELPYIDGHDSFPRYYMDNTRAKSEIISWLNWRLWKRQVS